MHLKYLRRYGSFFLFLTPALLFYITFLVSPILQGMYYSLTNWRFMVPDYEFIGFSNFITIFQDDQAFISSIFFTFKLVIVLVIIQNVLALGLALLIHASGRKLQGFFRTTFFMPHMISTIIATFIFSFIFSNVLLEFSETIPLLSFLDQPWLGDPDFAFWSLVIVHLWNGVPLMMIIYLAGLSGVPNHLKESALIDGANGFQILKNIILPMIMPALTICVFLTLKEAFKTFEIVYALTDGGPGKSTEVMTLNIYNEAFSSNFLYGYASAKAMLLFLFVLVISIIQIGIMKKREVEA
ncbi:carbohydrate ABC transporter permease [Gracilibacillus phocaeensis]|uniref:carbohydrate ABC transporter permease n=1 Tax=Gracilibacillus phocaeensis TaxID=2042304 RepID=UPI00102FC535|nr:sugar ABC transporter permease [Gracilibacillus phocaeensis]